MHAASTANPAGKGFKRTGIFAPYFKKGSVVLVVDQLSDCYQGKSILLLMSPC